MSTQTFKEKYSHCSNKVCGRKLRTKIYVLNDEVFCRSCYKFLKSMDDSPRHGGVKKNEVL